MIVNILSLPVKKGHIGTLHDWKASCILAFVYVRPVAWDDRKYMGEEATSLPLGADGTFFLPIPALKRHMMQLFRPRQWIKAAPRLNRLSQCVRKGVIDHSSRHTLNSNWASHSWVYIPGSILLTKMKLGFRWALNKILMNFSIEPTLINHSYLLCCFNLIKQVHWSSVSSLYCGLHTYFPRLGWARLTL